MKPRVIIIAGPTASGKTRLAIDLAKLIQGEIVSADSIQIYRGLDIGSAKPSTQELAEARHHLIDIRNPDEEFSGGDFVREARAACDDILSRGLVPIVVGGTGLYVRLLLGGVAELPPTNPELRSCLRAEAGSLGAQALYERLLRLDPQGAQSVESGNLTRIIRRLEIIAQTGRPFSEIIAEHALKDRPYEPLYLCLNLERSILYERIDKRVDSMIKEGLLNETAGLVERGYSLDIKPLQSLGYRHMGLVLTGCLDMLSAVELMKRDTRHYAKRQITWFRSESAVRWIGPDEIKGAGLMVVNFLGKEISGFSLSSPYGYEGLQWG